MSAAAWSLPSPLPGERVAVEGGGPRLALQIAQPPGPVDAVPLLMLHGLDAAASPAMLAPLFEAQARHRPVAAPDLPGFGASAAPGLTPDPPMLVRAALRSAARLRQRGWAREPDLLAVGDACEIAALAVVAAPRAFRSVLLVSPTGLESLRVEGFHDGLTQAPAWARALLAAHAPASLLVRAALAGPLLRWHLQRQWGARATDPAWLAHARRCREVPGHWRGAAAWASGALATRGIAEVMARIARPVWVAHGTRAAGGDIGALARFGPPSHWRVDAFDTGPLPFREAPAEFGARLAAFCRQWPTASWPTSVPSPGRQRRPGGTGTLSADPIARH